MKKLIRRSILLGMGVYSLTKDKLDKFVSDLEKDKKLSRKEGRKLADDLLKDVGTYRKKLVKVILSESGLATKEDIKRIEKKLAESSKKS